MLQLQSDSSSINSRKAISMLDLAISEGEVPLWKANKKYFEPPGYLKIPSELKAKSTENLSKCKNHPPRIHHKHNHNKTREYIELNQLKHKIKKSNHIPIFNYSDYDEVKQTKDRSSFYLMSSNCPVINSFYLTSNECNHKIYWRHQHQQQWQFKQQSFCCAHQYNDNCQHNIIKRKKHIRK